MDEIMDEYGEYYDEDVDGSDSQSPGQQFYSQQQQQAYLAQ